MPLPAYLPDPSKWIETSSSKTSKAAPTGHRPLVGWKHGFATPPLTAPRTSARPAVASSSRPAARPSASKRAYQGKENGSGTGETRTDTWKQETLGGFFTPPLTASAKRIGKARAIDGDGPGGTDSPVPRQQPHQADRTKRPRSKLDSGWGSSGDEDVSLPSSSSRPLRELDRVTGLSGKSRPRTQDRTKRQKKARNHATSSEATRPTLSAFSSGELSDLPPEYSSNSPPSSIPSLDFPMLLSNTTPIAAPPIKPTRHTPAIPSSQLPLGSSSARRVTRSAQSTRTPSGVPLHSERDLTPVPSSVLAIHRRLCGQDPKRLASIKSPWAKRPRQNIDDLQLAKKPAAGTSPLGPLKTKLKKNASGRRLVQLSDEEGSPVMPLSPLRTNTVANKRKRMSAKDEKGKRPRMEEDQPDFVPKVTSPPLRTITSVLADVDNLVHCWSDALPTSPRPPRPPKTSNNPVSPRPVSPMQRVPSHRTTEAQEPTASSSDGPPLPSSPLTHFIRPVSPFAAEIGRHTITPPKSKSPQMREKPFRAILESSPPPMPDFIHLSIPKEEKKQKGFIPTQNGAETLLTWSLGQHAATSRAAENKEKRQEELPPLEVNGFGGTDDAMNLDFGETQGRRSSGASTDQAIPGQPESQSLAPSIASQQFPVLVPSPTAKRTSRDTHRRHSRSRSPTKRQRNALAGPSRIFETCYDASAESFESRDVRPRASAGWKALEMGILSVPIPEASSHSQSLAGGRGKKRALPDPKHADRSNKQSQLASFGFFPDKAKPAHATFANAWEDEPDLDLDAHNDEAERSSSPGASSAPQHLTPRPAGWSRIPDAPHHPSLQPAGIRELQKRSNAIHTSKAEGRARPVRPDPTPLTGTNLEDENSKSSRGTTSDNPSSDSAVPTSDFSSSLASDAPGLPKPSPRTKAWWDNLG